MKKYSKEEKEMWLDDWRQSGKSAWSYAKANNLNPQTFTKWTKAETAAKVRMVEVPAPIIQHTLGLPEILIEKGDIKIHIPLEIERNGLRAVMESLAAVI